MGFLFGSREAARPAVSRGWLSDTLGVSERGSGRKGAPASADHALRFSAVWAALRLRADHVSSLPVDVFRKVDGAQVPAPAPRLFTRPAEDMLWPEWMFSTQIDLDRFGNCMGLIESREQGWPVQIEPWAANEVTIRLNGRRIVGYRYDGREYAREQVWHERQYTVGGSRVGLSPLAYAAWAVGAALSAQEFGLDWYANGAHPSGTLRHTQEANLDQRILAAAKERFRAAVSNRDLFVTGSEWEYSPAAVDANSAQFLGAMGAAAVDVARFIGVPASAIDAAVSGQALTYANLTQKQLDLLVNYLNAPIVRRETAFTVNACPQPRFVKLNTDAMLRLDPAARTDQMVKQIDAWLMDPDEGRGLLNLPPLTEAQIELLKARRKSSAKDAKDAESEEDPS